MYINNYINDILSLLIALIQNTKTTVNLLLYVGKNIFSYFNNNSFLYFN